MSDLTHFLIITDTNGRQYLFKVEDGLSIQTVAEGWTVTVDEPNLPFIVECIDNDTAFVVNGSDAFNPANLTAVQLKAFPTAEIG